jgi:hypothetical protein
MSGFEVVADQIRSAAGQAKAAADGVKGADPSGDVGDVSAALPGSESAEAAAKLTDAWKQRFQGWYDDGVAQGEKMTASAESYDITDYNADLRLRNMMRHLGETIR